MAQSDTAMEVTTAQTTEQVEALDLRSTELYANRELSWLDFNERVLELAEDEQLPLLERVKFLAIYASNLDEFFMVRVAGLHDQVDAGHRRAGPTASPLRRRSSYRRTHPRARRPPLAPVGAPGAAGACRGGHPRRRLLGLRAT